MRILIEPGGYRCCNMGDLSMLLVALDRLWERWPDAEIVTFSGAPDRLRRHSQRVVPWSLRDREELLAAHHPGWGLAERLALSTRIRLGLEGLMASAADRNWRQICQAARHFASRRISSGAFSQEPRPGKAEWRRRLKSFSLVAVSGAGGLCDPFLRHAWSVLELLEVAVSAGAPTALFSQGLGPIEDPALRSKARRVLPCVDLIAVRERREGPRLLRELGVPEERVQITGDDAVDFAFKRRRAEAGGCLGINLRLSGYSKVRSGLASATLQCVAGFARDRSLELLPIPISFHEHEADLDAVVSIAAASTPPCPDEPAAVVRRVGRCRLVVTGSYHAAVFALAQGIPVVALSNSLYYDNKFLGLAELFGAGCHVVRLGDAGALPNLRAALERLWNWSAGLRDPLLRSAREQIGWSQAAYQRGFELVCGRSPAGESAVPARRAAVLSPALP